jgi:hypothetical protein
LGATSLPLESYLEAPRRIIFRIASGKIKKPENHLVASDFFG